MHCAPPCAVPSVDPAAEAPAGATPPPDEELPDGPGTARGCGGAAGSRCGRARRRRGVRGALHARPAPRAGLLGRGAGGGRGRRRHLVLEPVPGPAVRHPDHRLHLHLGPGARGRVAVVGEVRDPARDPALPAARGRAPRPAPRHPVRHPGRPRGVARGGLGLARRDRGGRGPARPARHHGDRSAVGAQAHRHRRAGRLRGRGRVHRSLARGRRRRHRAAGRGDRHRLVGDPGDPDPGARGGGADGVPAHPRVLRPRPQRAAPAAPGADARRGPGGLPGGGPALLRRGAAAGAHGPGSGPDGRAAQDAVRGRLAGR